MRYRIATTLLRLSGDRSLSGDRALLINLAL
jgi:hypothetical protein